MTRPTDNGLQHVIYFVAMRPDPVKALGGTMFFTREDAQATAEFWQCVAPFRVWRATVTAEEIPNE